MAGMPLITVGQVVAQDPDGGGVTVVLRTTGQAPGYPVRMLYNGPADSLRIEQQPLPGRGTWGIVAFPYNDPRNGIWLGSFFPSQIDAIANLTEGSGPVDANESNIKYSAHFSGYYTLLDQVGQSATVYPDGSFAIVGSGFSPPTIYRHTLEDRKRVRSEFKQEQRVLSPPSPYNWTVHTSGSFGVTAVSGFSYQTSGAFTVSGASVAVSGSSSVSIDSHSGDVAISAGSTKITVSNSGSVTIVTTGQLKIGASASLKLALAAALKSLYDAHTHPVTSAPGTSGPPIVPLSGIDASDIRVTS